MNAPEGYSLKLKVTVELLLEKLNAGKPAFDEETIAFFTFVHARQEIWHKRTVLAQDPPWTNDEILRKYHWTNMQRELDRATIYIRTQLSKHSEASLEEQILNILLFNWLRRPSPLATPRRPHATYDDLGGWVTRRTISLAGKRLIEVNSRPDITIFGRDVQAPGGNCQPPVEDSIRRLTGNGTLLEMARALAKASSTWKSCRDPWRQLKEYRVGFGDVIALQSVLDFTYLPEIRLTDDEWVYFHVGDYATKRDGWKMIGPAPALYRMNNINLNTMSKNDIRVALRAQDELLAKARRLRDIQDEGFSRAGVDWASVAWAGKPQLTLADIDHSLCEYGKYVLVVDGSGNGPRYHFATTH